MLQPLLLSASVVMALSGTPQVAAVTQADHQRAQTRYEEGWQDLAAEHWMEAAKDFQGAIDIDSTFKLAYYGLGRAHMGLKEFVRAASAYERCRDLYAAQFGARMSGRVDVDRLIADDSLQLDLAIRQLASGPQSTQKQTQIAQLQNQKQRLQMKGHGLESMSITDGVPAFISLALGSAYFRGERLTEAETAYKAAILADPKVGEAHSNLAVVYLQAGRLDDAEREVKAAEKTGYHVNPNLKDDIEKKKKAGR